MMGAVQALIKNAAVGAVLATAIATTYKLTVGRDAVNAPQEYYAARYPESASAGGR